MKTTVEREWTTEAGLPAVCLENVTSWGRWRCGYVAIPFGHPLYGRKYNAVEDYFDAPENVLEVHGGVTFSGRLSHCAHDYLYGFDCNHLVDEANPKDEEFVVKECEKLARQIAQWGEGPVK